MVDDYGPVYGQFLGPIKYGRPSGTNQWAVVSSRVSWSNSGSPQVNGVSLYLWGCHFFIIYNFFDDSQFDPFLQVQTRAIQSH